MLLVVLRFEIYGCVKVKNGATIDNGPDDNWMVGQFMAERFMNIGWSVGGPPMMVADYPEEMTHL